MRIDRFLSGCFTGNPNVAKANVAHDIAADATHGALSPDGIRLVTPGNASRRGRRREQPAVQQDVANGRPAEPHVERLPGARVGIAGTMQVAQILSDEAHSVTRLSDARLYERVHVRRIGAPNRRASASTPLTPEEIERRIQAAGTGAYQKRDESAEQLADIVRASNNGSVVANGILEDDVI